jgi:hypothetical protein
MAITMVICVRPFNLKYDRSLNRPSVFDNAKQLWVDDIYFVVNFGDLTCLSVLWLALMICQAKRAATSISLRE